MPTYRITAPDGKTYNVTPPEGQDVTPETIMNLFKGEAKPKPMTQDEYGTAKAANMAGLGFGVGDEILAGLGSVFRQDLGNYDEQLKYIRGAQDKLNREDFGASITSNLIGGIPAALATGGPASGLVSRALPSLGRVGNAAVTGAGFAAAAGFGSGEGGVENRLASAALAAPWGATFGATVEGVASPLISRFITYLRGRPELLDQAGNITPQGSKLIAQYAQTAKVDPAELSAGLQKELLRQAQAAGTTKAINPEQVIALQQAKGLPVPVPMTKGQLSQVPDQQMFESQAVKGVYGEGVGDPIKSVYDEQFAALNQNVDAIRQRLSGSQTLGETGARGSAVQSALTEMRDTAQQEVRSLYNSARRGGDAAVEPTAYRNAVQNILGKVMDDFSPDTIPKVFGRLDAMNRAAQEAGSSETLISSIFRTRRQLVSLQAEGGVEGAAAGTAKRALDEHLLNSIDDAALSGDKQAITRWKDAISKFRDYASKYESGNLVEKLTDTVDFQKTLKVDPEDAMKIIFGRAETGFTGKVGMVRELRNLKETLGETSEAWRALKEEAFLRFANTAKGAVLPTERGFSGAKLAKAWQDATDKSPELLRTIFTDEERALIGQFVRVAQRVTTVAPGGVNSSNTSGAVIQAMRKLFSSAIFGPRVAAFLEGTPVLKGFLQIPDRVKAAGAAQAVPGVTNLPPSSLATVSPNAEFAVRNSVPIGGQMIGQRQ